MNSMEMFAKNEQEGKKFDNYLNYALIEQRVIMISEGVSSKLTRRVSAQLFLLDMQDPEKEIKIILNSPGGSADDGFAIYDAIRSTRAPVKILCIGLTASAGTIIFCAAKKENRLSFPNTRILMHQPSSGIMGTASDIKISAEEIVKLREKADGVIAEATGQTRERIAKDTSRDFWLGAEEAKEYGLVGRIVNTLAEI